MVNQVVANRQVDPLAAVDEGRAVLGAGDNLELVLGANTACNSQLLVSAYFNRKNLLLSNNFADPNAPAEKMTPPPGFSFTVPLNPPVVRHSSSTPVTVAPVRRALLTAVFVHSLKFSLSYAETRYVANGPSRSPL